MSNDPSLASHTAANSLQVAATALAVLREARTTSADACLAYQLTLPSEQRSSARTDRVPVIVVGPPLAALECTVAMLATCSSAAALALELSLTFDDAPRVAVLTTAVEATSRSAGIAVRALHLRGSTDLRLQLAHATARATHQVADALSARGIGHDPRVKARRSEFLHNRFPPSWRDVIACLGERLASRDLEDEAAARAAAAAAPAYSASSRRGFAGKINMLGHCAAQGITVWIHDFVGQCCALPGTNPRRRHRQTAALERGHQGQAPEKNDRAKLRHGDPAFASKSASISPSSSRSV